MLLIRRDGRWPHMHELMEAARHSEELYRAAQDCERWFPRQLNGSRSAFMQLMDTLEPSRSILTQMASAMAPLVHSSYMLDDTVGHIGREHQAIAAYGQAFSTDALMTGLNLPDWIEGSVASQVQAWQSIIPDRLTDFSRRTVAALSGTLDDLVSAGVLERDPMSIAAEHMRAFEERFSLPDPVLEQLRLHSRADLDWALDALPSHIAALMPGVDSAVHRSLLEFAASPVMRATLTDAWEQLDEQADVLAPRATAAEPSTRPIQERLELLATLISLVVSLLQLIALAYSPTDAALQRIEDTSQRTNRDVAEVQREQMKLTRAFERFLANAENSRRIVTHGDGATVRTHPQPGSAVVVTLPAGASGEVIGKVGKWINLAYEDAQFGTAYGWSLNKYWGIPHKARRR